MPSGRLNEKLTLSPSLGLVAPRLIETPDGDPAGPVTVAPVSEDETALNFRPNGEPAASSTTCTDVGVGELIIRRPRPLVPRSACWRSEITCFNPAWVVVPLRMVSIGATAGVLMALPENR